MSLLIGASEMWMEFYTSNLQTNFTWLMAELYNLVKIPAGDFH